MKVPDDLSLVGFDNTEHAFFEKLTSYDFAADTGAHLLLEYILHPERSHHFGFTPVEIPGTIIERGSVKGFSV
jgi:DNA-binding LacI/PurR family transcriptional regulator